MKKKKGKETKRSDLISWHYYYYYYHERIFDTIRSKIEYLLGSVDIRKKGRQERPRRIKLLTYLSIHVAVVAGEPLY